MRRTSYLLVTLAHSHAIVVDINGHEATGSDIGSAECGEILGIDFLGPGKYENRALAVIGIASAALITCAMSASTGEWLLQVQTKRDVLWNRAPDHGAHLPHQRGYVGWLDEEASLSRVGEQLFGEMRSALAGFESPARCETVRTSSRFTAGWDRLPSSGAACGRAIA